MTRKNVFKIIVVQERLLKKEEHALNALITLNLSQMVNVNLMNVMIEKKFIRMVTVKCVHLIQDFIVHRMNVLKIFATQTL